MGVFTRKKDPFTDQIGKFIEQKETQEITNLLETAEDMVRSVKIADVKQYLVDEYKRVDDLREENSLQAKKIEAMQRIKFEYDAALVIMDEMKKRTSRLEDQIKTEKEKINQIREEKERTVNELNNCKIILNNAKLTREEMEQDIKHTTEARMANTLLLLFQGHKGILKKETAIEYIREAIREEKEGEIWNHAEK